MAPHGNTTREDAERVYEQPTEQHVEPSTEVAEAKIAPGPTPAPVPPKAILHNRFAYLTDGTIKRRRAVSGQLSRRERRWELLLSKVPRATTCYETEPFVFRVRDYLVVERLGAGSGGRVYLSKHEKTGQRVAIKVIEKLDARKERKARKEAGVMRALGEHRHIVPLIDVVENEGSVCIVMGHAEGGDLFEYIGRTGAMNPTVVWRVFGQIVSAVAYAHSRGFIHRDVKPENIFIDADGNAMLGDWGYATAWSSWKKKRRPCGSLNYAASEIVSNKTYTGPEVDIFSLGGVLYTMLTGRLPFGSTVNKATLQRVIAGQWRMDSSLPLEIVDLLNRMFEPTPIRRATMMEVLQFVRATQQSLGIAPTSPRLLRSVPFEASSAPLNNEDATVAEEDITSSSEDNNEVEDMKIELTDQERYRDNRQADEQFAAQRLESPRGKLTTTATAVDDAKSSTVAKLRTGLSGGESDNVNDGGVLKGAQRIACCVAACE